MSVLDQALAFANDEKHGGAGYTLMIHLMGQTDIEVWVYPGPHFKDREDNDVFFNLAHVTAVSVLW
ncbi:hypothetical protein [Sphingomonas jaspsi]|uniref:hypothetical protein n=1 Tax=Sphingomonas jaspsi TaxID=392409 RepID=UPI0004B89EA1|nr:hypothetical protein [Sphingomonas jaspsi]